MSLQLSTHDSVKVELPNQYHNNFRMKTHDIIIPIVCVLGFILHTSINIFTDMFSNQTRIERSVRNITNMELPFYIQVAVYPAFNMSRLTKSPYGQAYFYFRGTEVNGKPVGWEERSKSGKLEKNVSGVNM